METDEGIGAATRVTERRKFRSQERKDGAPEGRLCRTK